MSLFSSNKNERFIYDKNFNSYMSVSELEKRLERTMHERDSLRAEISADFTVR